MTANNLNDRAANLKSKLWSLVNEFKDLQTAATVVGQHDAASDLDSAACKLASVYVGLSQSDLFIDAHRDPKDQSYAVEV